MKTNLLISIFLLLGLSSCKISNSSSFNTNSSISNSTIQEEKNNNIDVPDGNVGFLYSETISAIKVNNHSIEYIANIMDVADDFLFIDEEEENVMEGETLEEEQPGGMPSGGGDMDVDVDVDMGEEGGEEPAPVEPMENETFEEPQGAVVTMDDLIE